jgi:hypothetical protein
VLELLDLELAGGLDACPDQGANASSSRGNSRVCAR